MDKDTKVNIMSVDIAIQRELAYREKVARSLFHQDADFRTKFMPLQVQHSGHCHSSSPGPSSFSNTSSGLVQKPFSSPSPRPSPDPYSISIGSSSQVQLPSSSQSLRSQQAPLWAQTPRTSLSQSAVSSPLYQLPCSNQNSGQFPEPRQFPRPRPPGLAPKRSEAGKRKAKTSNLQPLPPCQPRPSRSSCIIVDQLGNFFCKACQVTCTGALSLKQHLKGHKHKAKMKWLELSKKDSGEKGTQCTSCDLCKIWCTDEKALELHLKGQKHMAKLHELELGQNSCTVGQKAIERPWCELCQIWCMNEEAFQQHLQGQKHVSRLKRGPRRVWKLETAI